MTDDKESERVSRLKVRADLKRTTVISRIRAIHKLAIRTSSDPDTIPEFLVAVSDLDSLWAQFKSEDDCVLDYLLALDLVSEYTPDLATEVRALINASKAIAAKLVPTGAEAIDLTYLHRNIAGTNGPADFSPSGEQSNSTRPLSRLPEIPLPQFDGDFRYWPTFRDRFAALVDTRSNLSNIDKMYYLIGCLTGAAADAVRAIPVSSDNYELALSTLASRFNRPRIVATSLIDKLLHTPPITQESLHELTNFTCTFSEGISLLKALNIPDMGSFILFSIAFRCLPVATRKMFESQTTSDYPSMNELLDFVQTRVSVLELVGEKRRTTNNGVSSKFLPQYGHTRKGGDRSGWHNKASPLTSLVAAKPDKSCPCCKAPHALGSCVRFQSWSVEDRASWTRDRKLCFICFSTDHWANKCRSKARCSECTRKHHSLLHPPTTPPRANTENPNSDVSLCASTRTPHVRSSAAIILGTALVHVRDRTGSWQTIRALVDCASQISAVTVDCADRLGLTRVKWTVPVTGLSGVAISNVQGRVECTVQPRFAKEPALAVTAWVLPSITGDLPRHKLPSRVKNRYTHLALADPSFDTPSPIDMLLGSDVYSSIMEGRKVIVDKDLPVAFNSIFGWILIGPVSAHGAETVTSLPVSLTISIEGLMERFWSVEEPEAPPEVFTEDGRCENIFREQCVRLPSGRFSVPLPFRTSILPDTFPGSRDMAVKRFESLERKLTANPTLKKLYVDFMSEYISLGHMSVATSPGSYLIPHHAVYRTDVDNSKLRVVFDASAHGYRSPSLNSCLLAGPKLQQDIVDILTRFRLYLYAFTSDICKMYRQILVLPEYRKYQHIVWRASPHEELREYELHTVTYGINCAPFLALRVLQIIASDDCEHHQAVRDVLMNQTYVDDICAGADSEVDAVALQSSLISVLSKSGLELKKWASNSLQVVNSVPSTHRACQPLQFAAADEIGTKVLGVEWHPEGDYLSCALRLDNIPAFTKRGVLSLVARIFDPLGLFGPTVLLAKIIMQKTWHCKLTWDEPLPVDIHDEWAAFVSDLPILGNIQVPRHINARQGAPCYLLGFCDASQSAYAAVVYIRMIDAPQGNSVFLLGTKTKLAPLKALTIPRLELNAALLLARWLGRLRKIMAPHLNIIGTRAWSDSMIVLSWLTVPHESFKIYVSNRIHQILTLLPDCQWQYIRSSDNPADSASRGIMPSELARHEVYWHGPPLIYRNPSDWTQVPMSLPLDELPETRPVSCTTRVGNVSVEWFERFSSFDHMLRVIARMRRFINGCRRQPVESNLVLTLTEIDDALRLVVLESQRQPFEELRGELRRKVRISSRPFARLCPFVDNNGVLRVGGRLRRSILPFDHKHPILLAKNSHLSFLICRRWHKITCHSGPRVMSALISRQFWIVSLRSVIHAVITKCTVCVRFDAHHPQPVMADLPAARVQQSRPFTHVGVDYAGPLQMRELSLRKSRVFKVYIAIFVCCSVKAVHLEVVSDLSTDAFMAAFDRFVARRGLPSVVYSDCGTNFVGAARQLRKLVNDPVSQQVITSASPFCSWHFNPPAAPHFRGLWEAAVRSAKRLLTRVVGTHILSYEELTTVLCRVEAVLNSRPLTPASSDPHDLECLTPGHFLTGQPLLSVPPRTPYNPEQSVVHRWKLLDQCHQAFWHRWYSEYLHTLQERGKWADNQQNLKVDDMVVIRDSLVPPLEWRLGRVTEVLPGPDGVVRVVRILTSRGLIVRPVVKVVVLPTE